MDAFWITHLGYNLLAKWGAGAPWIIHDVWVGSGRLDMVSVEPPDFTDLIVPVQTATTNIPITVNNQVQFIVEYRNDLHPAQAGFYLNEYGVFAMDPDLGRILLCYGNLGDFPELP